MKRRRKEKRTVGKDLMRTGSEFRENIFLRMTLSAFESVRLERTLQGDVFRSPPLKKDWLCSHPLSRILRSPLANCYSASLNLCSLVFVSQNQHIISHSKTLCMLTDYLDN